jgi:hypothetical protein
MGQMAEKKHSALEVDDALFECQERLRQLNPASDFLKNVINTAINVLDKLRASVLRKTTPTEDLWPPKK